MKKYRIVFGSYDDTQNYDWDGIREIMGVGKMVDLEELTFSKEEAQKLKEELDNSNYTGYPVKVVKA